MLIEFRLKNFRSFRDEQVLSMVASSDRSLDSNVSEVAGLRLLKSVGIYGPNASGKSNLIRAIQVICGLVADSASPERSQELRRKLIPFLLDEASASNPCSFEIVFVVSEIRYQYGFTADSKRFHNEWLIAYPRGHAQVWFERKYSMESGETDWKFGSFLKGEKHSIADKTRVDALFLSVATQWNNEQLKQISEWFGNSLRVLPAGADPGQTTARELLRSQTDADLKANLHAFVTRFLKDADLAITGVTVKPIELPRSAVEELELPEKLREIVLRRLGEDPPLRVELMHRNETTGREVAISLEDESDGTRRLFYFSLPWLQTVMLGFTVVVDELDRSLHPLLTRELIRFVQEPRDKAGKPQLVFASHDTTLLDPELLRRDQVWFCEKNGEGATQLYSLHDYKERRARKGEAMQSGYLSGRYGAIPILEAFHIE